jgi:stearoyl-CoA desaturase (delta-9 desaturase)
VVAAVHLLALLALLPSLFRWTSVAASFAGLYVFGTLGINLCYHRLLAHRAFECSSRLEHFLALLGICCLQDTPVHWVAAHRLHHQHSDEQSDPHSPKAGFFWSHIGWLWRENSELDRFEMLSHYVKDLLRDRFYVRLERRSFLVAISLAQCALFFLAGAAIGWLSGGRPEEAALGGASMLVWGVFVRTVLVWHITWSVNSVTHLWGYRRYDTSESSRNNWLIGVLSNGEGWHNNHHAQPRAAAHGHRWWELDVTYLTIRWLAMLGLVWDVVPVTPNPMERVND